MKTTMRLSALCASALLACFTSMALAAGKPGGGGAGGGGNTANSAIAYIGGGALKVMDADGANQTQVLAANSKHPHRHPTWYPDGQRLLFHSTLNGSGFYRVNLDGTVLTKVVTLNSSFNFLRAEVSPTPGSDGIHRIAFIDTDASGNRCVFIAFKR